MQDVLSSYFFSLLGRKVLECSRLPLRSHCTLADSSWKYFFKISSRLPLDSTAHWKIAPENISFNIYFSFVPLSLDSFWFSSLKFTIVNRRCSLFLLLSSRMFSAASKIPLHTGRLVENISFKISLKYLTKMR